MARSLLQPILLPHSHIADGISLSPYDSVVRPLLHSTTILCTPSFVQAQVLCSFGPLSPIMQISTASLCHYPPFSSWSVLVKTLYISSSRRPISAPAPAPAPNPAPAPGMGAAPCWYHCYPADSTSRHNGDTHACTHACTHRRLEAWCERSFAEPHHTYCTEPLSCRLVRRSMLFGTRLAPIRLLIHWLQRLDLL
ncbi:hypothetical protein DFH08DRAFT_867728 [Mycena albidolilacea]|uniref:Uncharacterized protein n=1 Tax=Mycena albidolilacea TaxID=1033008 RepID=A0AAD7A1X3_9AGAR|nr:hypothetical protein DFH08DRAFT_867728 [Mycena albidolilacea]